MSQISRVDIVIVNWNGANCLEACLRSLVKSAGGYINSVTVVDNCSTDGSQEIVRKFPACKLIELSYNSGFAKACNIGAANSDSEFLLFLNPDAEIRPESIGLSLAAADSMEHQKVAVFGVQLKDNEGSIQRTNARFPTPLTLLSRVVGAHRLEGRFNYIESRQSHEVSRFVDHVIGAYYFCRRDQFQSVGGFDETFFLYLEDLDLSGKIRASGWKIYFDATHSIRHEGGGVSRTIPARRNYLAQRARIQYAEKHFHRFWKGPILFAALVIDPSLRVLLSLLSGNIADSREAVMSTKLLFNWLVSCSSSSPRREA